jgi:tetratricopeptide (TPR) repeat protein
MTVKGWSATDVETACHRALELAATLERYDAMYPPLWGLWTVLFLRGELEPGLGAAQRVLDMAVASGVPMIESTGRHATAYTHLYRGELAEALREAEAGIALFDLDQERVLADMFQLSSGVCLSTARASALWLMGRLDEAVEEWERMRQIAADLKHPPSLAAALAFDCHLSGYRWSYPGRLHEVRPVAEELVSLCREEGFALWHGVGCAYLGMALASAGDPEQARRQIVEGLELFQQTGARLTLVMMNLEAAEALLPHGEDPTPYLDAAEEEMEARAEGMMAPEIWRLRGRWHRIQGREAETRAAFAEARRRAADQGATLLELRALLDLVDVPDPDVGDVEELRTVYGRFTQGFGHPELQQAARLLSTDPVAADS